MPAIWPLWRENRVFYPLVVLKHTIWSPSCACANLVLYVILQFIFLYSPFLHLLSYLLNSGIICCSWTGKCFCATRPLDVSVIHMTSSIFFILYLVISWYSLWSSLVMPFSWLPKVLSYPSANMSDCMCPSRLPRGIMNASCFLFIFVFQCVLRALCGTILFSMTLLLQRRVYHFTYF